MREVISERSKSFIIDCRLQIIVPLLISVSLLVIQSYVVLVRNPRWRPATAAAGENKMRIYSQEKKESLIGKQALKPATGTPLTVQVNN